MYYQLDSKAEHDVESARQVVVDSPSRIGGGGVRDQILPRGLGRLRALVAHLRPGHPVGRDGTSRAGRAQGLPVVTAARSVRWPNGAVSVAFLADLDSALRVDALPNVAVLIDDRPTAISTIIRSAYPAARVHVLPVGRKETTVHVMLCTKARFDVIIDDTHRGRSHVRLLRLTFFHLRAGGVYLVRDHRSEPDGSGAARAGPDLRTVVSALCEEAKVDPASARGRRRDRIMLGRSFGRVEIGKRHLLLSNDVTAYAKLREDELNRILLKDRARIGRVVDTRPAGTLVSRCVLRTGVDVREVADPKTFAVPTLSLRAYDDVICLAGQVVLAGNLILPDTYRHNQYERLRNRRTAELAPRFAQPKRPIDDARRLPGAYFYLDTELRDHFGHAMTEQLPRLWAWDRAKADEPDLRALVSLRSDRRSLSPWQVKLLEAAGVDEADIVTFRGAVRVEHLVGATSMFSMPSYVHPDLAQLWNRVGRTLENQSDGSPFGRRIFVSRRPSTTRPCHNVGDVERLFAAHGFDVVFPEDCDLPTQAAMFRSADVVAGFGEAGCSQWRTANLPFDSSCWSRTLTGCPTST